ncbi:cobalt chelatase [Propionigenium maris DSM 9537]|uniref:Cobalt chelatase n=1 Tax=Propionigenium maris DSM 9537 TaxID=1123000 RepID=A0A9W6GMK9_9FUSO|nr:sirohydrochlorin cobaltochelatase [Propionigenium maris]GLI57238.1 cobalt chelatase [Propionigenium maris DSM 9537]
MKLLAAGLLGIFLARRSFAHGGHHKIHSEMVLEGGDRKGILLVHFGTSKKTARERALDSIKNHVEEDFGGYEVREAYTSRMVIKKVYTQSGKRFLTPGEALKKMAEDGFTHVVVQATHVINGIESEHLKEEVRKVSAAFKDIRVGAPLLTSPEDYMEVADIFHRRYPEREVVLVGHGTPHHAGASYGMLQYILDRRGYKNILVGTVEGYPGLDEIIGELESRDVKEVVLVPLMVVAGVHAEEDIAGEWRETLEKRGIKVEVSMEGMGEIAEIQHLLIHHIEDAIDHVEEDMAKKKDNILREVV